MLAPIEQSPVSTEAPATLSAILTYHSEAAPGSKLTWLTATGQPFLFVEKADTTITVTVEKAIFAANPVTFLSHADHFEVTPVNDRELSIRVKDAPVNYFNPWVLSFNVDAGGVNGINSPTLLLVLPPSSADSTSVELQYSTSDGSFVLDSMVVLASLDVLINAITPFDITFNLIADSNVTFNASTPILGPAWLTPHLVSGTQLRVAVAADPHRFSSFQFVLDVGNVTVTSPDPILINATIGDG
jgi:hypothetical protein